MQPKMRPWPFVLALVTICCLTGLERPAWAVGATNHSELALRGALWFDSAEHPEYAGWLAAHRDALRAGAAYPDWGYAFDGFGDLAEDSHWPPYHREAAEYLRETYPQPWDADTERLVAFLLGIRAHWISDLNWHGLGGVEEGLIDVMSEQETNGVWGEAHTIADVGGEFIGAAQLDLSWAKLSAPWYVPTQDLVAIAVRLGHTQTEARDVNLGMLALRAEQLGMKFFGDRKIGYVNWAPLSPTLTSEYRDYFVGGMNDMSVHAMWSWDENIDWFENGVPAQLLANLIANPSAKILDSLHREHAASGAHGSFTLRDLERMGLSIQETGRGAYLRVKESKLVRPASPSAERAAAPFGTRSRSLSSAAPYALAGTHLAVGDLDADGADDLVVGLPGYSVVGGNQLGRIEVLSGGAALEDHESVDLATASSITRTGTLENGRFGTAVAVCDLNADGVDDLAVAAPTTDARDFGYRGRVEVFFGSAELGLAATPSLIITTEDVYENLGYTLASGHLDDDGHVDLVIGSPFAREGGRQRGSVAVFLSSATLARGDSVDIGSADWQASGEQSWAWFGHALAVARGALGEHLLLVGAPKWKQAGVQGAGRLYAYDLGVGTRAAATPPVFTITGTDEFDNTGSSFAVGNPNGAELVLALASPTRNAGATEQAGEVLLVPLQGLAGDLVRGDLSPSAVLLGNESFARFGHRVAFGDVDGDGDDELWVAEPWRDAGAPVFLAGSVYGFLGGDAFPSGVVSPARGAADLVFDETERAAFLGAAFAFPDMDGDGVTELAVAARASSAAAPEAGVVRVIGLEPLNRVFADGFEAGDLAAWNSAVP